MIKVDNVAVYNLEGAVRGMRAPYKSYDKSDSGVACVTDAEAEYCLGKADLDLMRKLFKAGPEHRKFMRQIMVCMDITAPFYWWKQFDKYQIGVVTDSESTMHTIAKKPFELSDFSFDFDDIKSDANAGVCFSIATAIINNCEAVRKAYIDTKDLGLWRFLIQLLPESYNQRRTVTFNYEVAASIVRQRRNHKLNEWNTFIDVLLEKLPYLSQIMEG